MRTGGIRVRESDYAVGENTAEAVRVLSGSAVLRRREGKLCQLIYSLEESDGKTGVKDCEYSVFNRSFQDLSCMRGKILKSLPNGGQLRRHEDGTVFAHLQRTTATDSLWDRVWNTQEQICVFRDEHGIHLISCRYGYRIARIDIYINIRPAACRALRIEQAAEC